MSGACAFYNKTTYLNLKNSNKKIDSQKCIEFLLTEVYKYLNGLSPDIMNTLFKLRQNTYNLNFTHLNLKILEQRSLA